MLSEPVGVDMDDIKYDLERVSSQESALKLVTTNGEAIQIPGVQSVHELHAWRLNEEKSCATVHVIVDDPSDHAFQQIAKTIRQCLHAYGIHSATIQPEVPTSGLSSATDVGERRQSSSGCSVHCGHVCGEKRCCG
jgi:zinc transporter 1